MRIDYLQAQKIFSLMLKRYRAKQYPFQHIETDLPQSLVLPEIVSDPLQHARHLFFACHYMRGTVISSHAFRILNELWKEHSWLFTNEILFMRDADSVAEALGTKIKWHKDQIGVAWLENARTMQEEWEGDPRNIFAGVSTKEALYRRVMGSKYPRPYRHRKTRHKKPRSRYRGFIGFQEKMTSMLAYFLEATGLIAPTALSAPIDFHHFRVYLATGMITLEEDSVRYEKVKALGIRLAERLQADFNLTQVEYGDIVWLWSLRSCRRAPYNKTVEVAVPGGGSVRQPVPVTWSEAQSRAHNSTCGRCLLADHCQFGVPAGVYYDTGIFLLRTRTSPPQQSLFTAVELPFEGHKGQYT